MITVQNYQDQYPKIKDNLPPKDKDGNNAQRTFKESYDFLVENDSRDTQDVKELFVEKINKALRSEGKSAPTKDDDNDVAKAKAKAKLKLKMAMIKTKLSLLNI